MVFNLSQLDKALLLDKNKMRLVTDKILNNLYQSSLGEEDIFPLLNQEEEDYSKPYPEKEDTYILIAKSEIHTAIEFLFRYETKGETLPLPPQRSGGGEGDFTRPPARG